MDDERINLLINNLHNVYVGKDYAQNSSSGNISLSGLDFYAKNHFPLCMKHIYGVLKTTHHLKHACRLQLGLFLKGIGLTYEDAMNFWRDEFTKKIDSGKFEKDYAYNIKHMYGLVGQRTSYSPYSCLKIINSSVGPGEQQGCPYKHWDPVYLRSKLNEVGISSEGKYLSFNLANNFERMLLGVEDIVDAATKGHFQIACGKYFQYTHGQENKNGINHPNQYFEDSVECKKESKDASRSTPKAIKKQKAVDTSVKVNDINWDEDM